MTNYETELLIIGGGINGCGVAADAAGRGLKVILCEKGDLASATSSASTKLIHGGLRYLEQFDFKLVRESLKEREILLKKAPHLIKPMAFTLPYLPQLRPAWLLRLGLLLYDYLAPGTLPHSKKLSLSTTAEGLPLNPQFKIAFQYYDCVGDDARLVIANAQAAREHHATILTHTECVSANRVGRKWQVVLRNNNSNESIMVSADVIVNATGPWVNITLKNIFGIQNNETIHLIKGSHIVVPKIFEGNKAYILQAPDNRIIFAIPYFEKFTLIGTTDLLYNEQPAQIDISEQEIIYLCEIINKYFVKKISPHDLIWSYAGLRTVQGGNPNQPAKISRDYHLILDAPQDQAPLLSIIGGKITTFRKLSEDILNTLHPYLPTQGQPWTDKSPLPGGNFNQQSFLQFLNSAKDQYSFLPESLITRYANNYGTLLHSLLNEVKTTEDLGENFGAGLYKKEINYLIEHEWAQNIDDIVWRRTKLGLFLNDSEIQKIKKYLKFKA